MNPLYPFLTVLLATLTCRAIEAAGPQSQDEILRIVLRENPSLKASRAKWEAMKARAWEDPTLEFDTELGRFVSVPANAFPDQMLALEQKIPISGKNLSRGRSAVAEAAGAFEELRRQGLDVIFKTRTAWFRLANAYAQLDLNRSNEALLKQFADLSQSQYEVGNQTAASILAAQIDLAKILETRASLESAVSDQESALNVLMNREPSAPLAHPPALTMTHARLPLQHMQALALAARPEVRIARRNIEAAEAKLQLAKREWIPDPAVNVKAQRYNSANQGVSEVDAGISINLPWLNYSKYSAEIREAQENLESTRQEFERAKTGTLGLVRDQLRKISTAEKNYELFRDKIAPLATQAAQNTRAGYESNKSDFLNVFTARRTTQEVESTLANYLMDYHVAIAELAAIVGVNPLDAEVKTETKKSK